MKIILSFFILMMMIVHSSGQTLEQEFVFHGAVKKMTLEKFNYSEPSKSLITKTNYDKKGRKIKEIDSYSSTVEYFYDNFNSTTSVLDIWYNSTDAKIERIRVEERNAGQQIILSGDMSDAKWGYYYIHEYAPNLHTTKWFIKGEIDYRTTEEVIDLNKYNIPTGFVPFEWDKKLSYGYIKKSYSYSDTKYGHDLFFEFVQKNRADNKVKFNFHGDDVFDAGNGSWQRFENGKEIEVRYISSASKITNFGHRFTYHSNGKLLSDTYGYFSSMPNTFMQRKVFIYNENGDGIKEIRDAENTEGSVVHYEYTYDDNRNWTSRKSIYSDYSGETINRNFEYYQKDEAEVKTSLNENIYQDYLKMLRANKPIAEAQLKNYTTAKTKKDNTKIPDINYKTLRSKLWQDFLPLQQTVDTIKTGDLNKDGLEDLVMVYQPMKLLIGERNEIRTLRILLQQKDGNYQLSAESTGAIAGEKMNDVFFSDIEIKKGILIITHEFIRGGSEHKYRFQNGGFYLIGASKSTGNSSYFSSTDYNLSTGKYILVYENWDENTELPESSKEEKFLKQALPNIENYELFSLEVGGDNL